MDPLEYTTPFQLTKTIRRDPYAALSPTKPSNSAQGKIVVITGGGTGLGAVGLNPLVRIVTHVLILFP
jgi:hypothetical protein